MRFLDAEGVRQLKELNDSTYVGKDEYNDDTMVISAALNDLNSRLTDAEADIAGASGGDINVIETIKVNGTALTPDSNKAVDITVSDVWEPGTGETSAQVKNSGTIAKGNYSVAEGFSNATTGTVTITGDADATTYTVSSATNLKVGTVIWYNTIARPIMQIMGTTITVPATFSTEALSGAECTYYNYGAHSPYSHVEGGNTIAAGSGAHAEGITTAAIHVGAHAEGRDTVASGNASHAEGRSNTASGNYSHAEGNGNTASGLSSHAEGAGNTASGNLSHAEGSSNEAVGARSHVEGVYNIARGNQSHAGGVQSEAAGDGSFAHGETVYASTVSSIALGSDAIVYSSGNNFGGFAFGSYYVYDVYPVGAANATQYTFTMSDVDPLISDSVLTQIFQNSIICKNGAITSTPTKITSFTVNNNSANVRSITITTDKTLSETELTGNVNYCLPATAANYWSFAVIGKALGGRSFSIGRDATSLGSYSATFGSGAVATNTSEVGIGSYNKSNTGTTHFSVGIGSNYSDRKNALEISGTGDAYLYGLGTYDGTNPVSGTNDVVSVLTDMIPTKTSDLTNDSNFTTNTGTITGVTMNGVSKGTSGVVDLGTVITDVSGKADASAAIGTLSLAIDNTNYQITLSGTKVDGTTFTVSNVIDLPLESVVVNGSYNDTTKKVVLTLQNGNTVDFSVADLVAGLQSEITSNNKLSADLIEDGTTNKVVTATEKSTWNAKADTASPTFTGTPTAPTATAGTNNTQIATTAFVTNAITSSSNKGTLEPSIFGSFSFSGSTLADVPPGSATVNATDKNGNNISSSDIGDYYDSASSKYPIIQIDVTVEGTSSSDPGYTTTLLFTEFSNTESNGLTYIGDFLQSGEIIAGDSNGLYYFYIVLDLNDTNIKINLHKRTANADWNATYGASKILNKPTIPTDSTVSGWGYIKSYTETDPVFSASAAAGISSSDITNWNGKTSNTGTITSVKMNGSTVSSSGEADLGTVITSHATHALNATNGTASAVNQGTEITYVESITGTSTATSGDLSVSTTRKKVTIPTAVTESTVSGWGFTKNAGTLTEHAKHKLTATNGTATSASGTITYVESLTGTNTATDGDLTVTATRKTVTIPTVNDSTISIQKGGTAVDSFTTNASSGKTINIPNELPSYSSSDSGKILSVNSSGALVWITPSYVYSGNNAPNNNIGNNGDIYLQTS